MAEHSRRDLFTGAAIQREAAACQEALAEAATTLWPDAEGAVALATVAMACDVEVFAPSGPDIPVAALSSALDVITHVESRISVYRPESELSRVNREAFSEGTTVESDVYHWLNEALNLAHQLEGAFDPTAGPLVALWQRCRREVRLPTECEIAAALSRVGFDKVRLSPAERQVRFSVEGMSLNLNAFGKGAALDAAARLLIGEEVESFCLHAGRSSVYARGRSDRMATAPGWTVAISNPLMAHHRLARLRLVDSGLSTSGNGIQFYSVSGHRYGHVLDPRSGWPAEGFLSVSVVAPTAAEAEALSTAFFVLGVEKARQYCHNRWSSGVMSVGAVFVPVPVGGRFLRPVVVGLSPAWLEFEPGEVSSVDWLDPQEAGTSPTETSPTGPSPDE